MPLVGSAVYYYLFVNPSFLSGIARTLDLGGHYDAYNFSPTPEGADEKEILDDWHRVYTQLLSSWRGIIRENPEFIRELRTVCSPELLPSINHSEAETDEFETSTQSR